MTSKTVYTSEACSVQVTTGLMKPNAESTLIRTRIESVSVIVKDDGTITIFVPKGATLSVQNGSVAISVG
jgi:hypothetical protein